MTEIKRALLLGLKKYGRKKTFREILKLSGFDLAGPERLELANDLETSGFIQAVTYGLPVEIRAELSKKGKDLLIDGQDKKTLLSFLSLFASLFNSQGNLQPSAA